MGLLTLLKEMNKLSIINLGLGLTDIYVWATSYKNFNQWLIKRQQWKNRKICEIRLGYVGFLKAEEFGKKRKYNWGCY